MYMIMHLCLGRGGGGGRGLASRGGGGSALRGRGRGPKGVKGRESESGGGIKGGSKVLVTPHRHAGVFIAKSKGDALVTKNLVPGETVYNEKRISVQNEDRSTVEYRVWNPHRSKLAAAIHIGVDNIWIVSPRTSSSNNLFFSSVIETNKYLFLAIVETWS